MEMNIEIDHQKLRIFMKIFFIICWVPKIGNWWRELYLSRLVYRLEDDCVVCEQGVFRYSKKRVPLLGIREVSVYRGPILQLFGGSIVRIHTAGRNQGFSEVYLLCPADPEGLVQEITKRVTNAKA